jgi:hypothetical protein
MSHHDNELEKEMLSKSLSEMTWPELEDEWYKLSTKLKLIEDHTAPSYVSRVILLNQIEDEITYFYKRDPNSQV